MSEDILIRPGVIVGVDSVATAKLHPSHPGPTYYQSQFHLSKEGRMGFHLP